MQTARIDQGAEIEARAFARLTEDERDAYKGRLSCPNRDCGAPSHFRRRSKDGKPDLFFSTRHVPGCLHRTSSDETVTIEGDPVETAAVWNDATDLVLRFSDTHDLRPQVEIDEVPGAPARGHRHSVEHGELKTSTSSTSLRPLLRRLRDEPNFRSSSRCVNIGHGVTGPISSLCVEAQALEVGKGRRLVVWGPVFSARGEWIDCAPRSEHGFGVRVAKKMHDDLATRNALASWDELRARSSEYTFIVVGELRETTNGAPYITAEGPQHVGILRG